jgi:hypothetical protein
MQHQLQHINHKTTNQTINQCGKTYIKTNAKHKSAGLPPTAPSAPQQQTPNNKPLSPPQTSIQAKTAKKQPTNQCGKTYKNICFVIEPYQTNNQIKQTLKQSDNQLNRHKPNEE